MSSRPVAAIATHAALLTRRIRRKAYRAAIVRRYGARLRLHPTAVLDGRIELDPGARLSIGPRALVEHRLQVWGTVTVELGEAATARMDTRIYGTGTVRVGARSVLNATKINCLSSVDIGDDCLVSAALITDTDFHNLEPRLRRSTPQAEVTEAVTIEHNVWVGYGCIVLKGVTVGRDSVLAAGAVVRRDVPPGVVVSGNPATVVRTFGEDELTT